MVLEATASKTTGPAVVFVHYRLPEQRFWDHLEWNGLQYGATGATVWVVTDPEFPVDPLTLPSFVRQLVYPASLPHFSLAKTANFGLRQALEAGHDPLLKTDPDMVLPNLAALLAVDAHTANVPRYRDIAHYGGPFIGDFRPRGEGIVCLTAANWQRVQGYHEGLWGWGVEDNELVQRLRSLGLRINKNAVAWHVAHAADRHWNPMFNPPRSMHNWRLARQRPPQPHWGLLPEHVTR